MEQNAGQNGNVLFLILLAIGFFAALSFAVTSSSRSGNADTTNEKASIGSGEILDLISSYDTAILRLKANGCATEQLSVTDLGAAPSMGRAFGNANAPPDGHCNISKLTSTSAKISSSALDPIFAGRPTYGTIFTHRNFGVTGVQNNGNSGYLIVPYVTDKTCKDINKKLFGISSIPVASGSATNNYEPWDGTLQPGPGVINCSSSDLGNNQCGEEMGCFKMNTFNDFNEVTNASTAGNNVNMVYKRIIDAN